MNSPDSNPQGKAAKIAESLEMLEKEKLKAEIGRLNAQEALIRDKTSSKWYEDSSLASQLIRGLFQAVATVLIGIPILWFYVENVVKPGVEVRVLESRKNNLQEEIELNQRIQEINSNLRTAQASHTQTKEQLEQANQELGEALATLRVVRAELGSLRTTDTPENVNATLDSATNQINSAEQTIDSLQQSVQAEQENAEERIETTNQLQEQLPVERSNPPTPEDPSEP